MDGRGREGGGGRGGGRWRLRDRWVAESNEVGANEAKWRKPLQPARSPLSRRAPLKSNRAKVEQHREESSTRAHSFRQRGTMPRFLAFVLVLALSSAVSPITSLRQCGNTTTFCADTGECCHAQYSPTTFGCKLGGQASNGGDVWPPSPTASCCMPGPELEPSKTKPNCLVVGDVRVALMRTDLSS